MIKIREERSADYNAVYEIILEAFKSEKLSDHQEQFLVNRLRRSTAFIPELSLVAELAGKVVGHILLTRIKIKGKDKSFDSLTLAPVTVKPTYQKRGIGGKLILKAHKIARDLGHTSIVLLGHENYYP